MMRRERKGVIFLAMSVLILTIMGLCTNCTQDIDSITGASMVYKNETFGFSLEFPKEWKDKYIIEESDHNIAVFNRKVNEKIGGGLLFTIERVVGELITEEDMKQAPVSQQIVLQGNGYTYFTRMPSDMQYPPDDEELSSDYKAMYEQIANISHSISVLGDKKPEAANEGFKVVGSSFFTLEIPNECELRASALRWDIYAGDNRVGAIELIPYKSEGPGGVSKANDNMMREYLFNDEAFREIRITLNPKFADQEIMGKIKNSLKFSDGSFNVIDLHYNAAQYVAGGGKKIFGKIEDFEIENGKPAAVRVKVMNLLTDDSDGKYPNGMQIEDLNRIETYPVDFGVNVAPLAAPDYNTYGLYEMPLLDEYFIKNYENYKDFFYDFIIGRDGRLKIILGRLAMENQYE